MSQQGLARYADEPILVVDGLLERWEQSVTSMNGGPARSDGVQEAGRTLCRVDERSQSGGGLPKGVTSIDGPYDFVSTMSPSTNHQ